MVTYDIIERTCDWSNYEIWKWMINHLLQKHFVGNDRIKWQRRKWAELLCVPFSHYTHAQLWTASSCQAVQIASLWITISPIRFKCAMIWFAEIDSKWNHWMESVAFCLFSCFAWTHGNHKHLSACIDVNVFFFFVFFTRTSYTLIY